MQMSQPVPRRIQRTAMFLGWEYLNELDNWIQNCLFQGKEELFLHPQNVVIVDKKNHLGGHQSSIPYNSKTTNYLI